VGVAKTPYRRAENDQTWSTWTECFLNKTHTTPGEGPNWAGCEYALISKAVAQGRIILTTTTTSSIATTITSTTTTAIRVKQLKFALQSDENIVSLP